MKYYLTVCVLVSCGFFLSITELNIGGNLIRGALISVKRIVIQELDCLVANAYHEGRGEDKLGRQLITQVVINRAERASKSFCEIIFQPNQFSWTSSKSKKGVPKDVYHEFAFEIYELYNDKSIIPTDFYDVTHFHEIKVNPYWSKKLVKIGIHNQHVFYKGN